MKQFLILVILLTLSQVVNCQTRLPNQICFTNSQLDSIQTAISTIVFRNELYARQINLYELMTDVQSDVIKRDSVIIVDLRVRIDELERKEQKKKKWYNNKLLYLGVGIISGTVLTLTL